MKDVTAVKDTAQWKNDPRIVVVDGRSLIDNEKYPTVQDKIIEMLKLIEIRITKIENTLGITQVKS